MLNKELTQKIRSLYSKFREAEKMVVPDLSEFPSQEEIKKMDESFSSYYHAVDDIRAELGKLLDDIDKGNFD